MVILLQIVTLIYARVVKANNIMNPELSCMDGKFSAYNSVFIMFNCPSEVHGTNFLQLSNAATLVLRAFQLVNGTLSLNPCL